MRTGRFGAIVFFAFILQGARCLQAQGAAASGPPRTDSTIRLSVPNFRQFLGSDRLTISGARGGDRDKSLESLLPAALRLALLRYPWIEVSDPGAKGAQSLLQQGLDAVGMTAAADYVLDGTYMVMDSKVRIGITLKRRSGAMVYTDSSMASMDTLLSSMEPLAIHLGDRLRPRLETARSRISVVLASPLAVTGGDSKNAALASFLPEVVASTLDRMDFDNVDFQTMDSRGSGDFLVKGAISSSGDRITMKASVVERGTPLVELTTSASAGQPTLLADRMARQIAYVIRARWTPKGEWVAEPASFASHSAAEYLTYARQYRASEQFPRAVLMYRKALEADDRSIEARYALADVYQLQGDYGLATAEYEGILAFNPTNSAAEAGLGDLAIRAKDYASAIQHYLKAVNAVTGGQGNPDQAGKLLESLGQAYLLAGKTDDAIATYRRAVQTDPKDPHPYDLISRVYQSSGKMADALAVLNEGLSRFPGERNLKQSLARVYRQRGIDSTNQGNYAEAVDNLQKMLAQEPSAAVISDAGYDAIITSFHKLQRDQESVGILRSELQRNPKNSTILNDLSLVYHDYLYDYESAYAVNQARFSDNADDAAILMDFAETCLTTNRFDQVSTLITKALAAPNLAVEYRLVLRMLSISALLYLAKAPEAYVQVGEFIGYYNSLPPDYERNWVFLGTRKFVSERELKTADRELILALLDVLEASKADAPQKLDKLRAALPEKLEPRAEAAAGK